MTRFQTILAQLCASSGCTMLHVDSLLGDDLVGTLSPGDFTMLTEALGVDNVIALSHDQEVQIIVPGTPSQAEASGHVRMMKVIKALIGAKGSSAMLVTGSGKVSLWEQGKAPTLEPLEDTLLTTAIERRAGNHTELA